MILRQYIHLLSITTSVFVVLTQEHKTPSTARGRMVLTQNKPRLPEEPCHGRGTFDREYRVGFSTDVSYDCEPDGSCTCL